MAIFSALFDNFVLNLIPFLYFEEVAKDGHKVKAIPFMSCGNPVIFQISSLQEVKVDYNSINLQSKHKNSLPDALCILGLIRELKAFKFEHAALDFKGCIPIHLFHASIP